MSYDFRWDLVACSFVETPLQLTKLLVYYRSPVTVAGKRVATL